VHFARQEPREPRRLDVVHIDDAPLRDGDHLLADKKDIAGLEVRRGILLQQFKEIAFLRNERRFDGEAEILHAIDVDFEGFLGIGSESLYFHLIYFNRKMSEIPRCLLCSGKVEMT
jgi:hypothetical protein